MKNVIVVGDKRSDIDSLADCVMKNDNVRVEVYTDADEALTRVTTNNFDLLITEYNLKNKNINGLQIARLTYALGKPIIINTNHNIIARLHLWCGYTDMINSVDIVKKGNDLKNIISDKLSKGDVPLSEMWEKIGIYK